MYLRKMGGKVWTGCIWLRLGPLEAVMNTVMDLHVP